MAGTRISWSFPGRTHINYDSDSDGVGPFPPNLDLNREANGDDFNGNGNHHDPEQENAGAHQNGGVNGNRDQIGAEEHLRRAQLLDGFDVALTCLTNQIELEIQKSELDAGMQSIRQQMDALNVDVDDVTAGHYDLFDMIQENKDNHLTLQSAQSKLESDIKVIKKAVGRVVSVGAWVAVLGVVLVGYGMFC